MIHDSSTICDTIRGGISQDHLITLGVCVCECGYAPSVECANECGVAWQIELEE